MRGKRFQEQEAAAERGGGNAAAERGARTSRGLAQGVAERLAQGVAQFTLAR